MTMPMPEDAEMAPRPTVGHIVHYVSYGTPVRADGSQAFKSECRAAIITEIDEGGYKVGLFVVNPTGVFLNRDVPFDGYADQGGTWHWPERVE